MHYKYVVKTLVAAPDGSLLALWRSTTDTNSPGRVDLPGGGMEPDEKLVETARREAAEEASIALDMADLKLVYSFTMLDEEHDTTILRFLFVGRTGDKTVTLSHEHDRYAWLSREDFMREFTGTPWSQALPAALRELGQ